MRRICVQQQQRCSHHNRRKEDKDLAPNLATDAARLQGTIADSILAPASVAHLLTRERIYSLRTMDTGYLHFNASALSQQICPYR